MSAIPKIPTKVERNRKVMERALRTTPEVARFAEYMKRRHRTNIWDEKAFPVLNESFSWRQLEAKIGLREADTSATFVQFLRAGIQVITNAAYMTHPTTYEKWVTVIQSKLDTELYAPNHGVAFPRQVGPSELFPEVGAAALSLSLKNLKFGAIFACERELLEDDQTGSFQMQAGKLGEYMKILAEVLCYGKLASVSGMKYIDYSIPVSETQPTNEANYPWSQAFQGGGANRPASYTLPTVAVIQAGRVGLLNQKNLQGIKMQVLGDMLICGPNNELDISTILNSTFYPAGASTTPGAQTGAFAKNFLQGTADLVVSPFVFKNDGTVAGDSKAWFLVDSKKPFFVLQMREAATVEQEATNAGESFSRDIYRFKGRSRMNADWIDPRFAWQGNDGSVTS